MEIRTETDYGASYSKKKKVVGTYSAMKALATDNINNHQVILRKARG
jgi:hypothetical protein